MRLDKFLKVSRLVKRRTVANEMASLGRVELNGKTVKAATEVKEGDILSIRFGERKSRVRVLKLCESARKEDADAMYELLAEATTEME